METYGGLDILVNNAAIAYKVCSFYGPTKHNNNYTPTLIQRFIIESRRHIGAEECTLALFFLLTFQFQYNSFN